ncbi:hypothetical protein QFC20_006048 [Naganishia adeliensis]|uniref:Uncharacterized protein n=1 Tax=Naganishia adeliensis TaxID=92952 RepID=A0ACC2VFD1_9TREE|nr:hypothetical protein QFC20_006048 [Naganishia adeliensis]
MSKNKGYALPPDVVILIAKYLTAEAKYRTCASLNETSRAVYEANVDRTRDEEKRKQAFEEKQRVLKARKEAAVDGADGG